MTISNISLQDNKNPQGLVIEQNVIYDVSHADGSVERVNRLWRTFQRPRKVDSRPICPPLLRKLQKYAEDFESARKTAAPNTLFAFFGDMGTTRTQIKAPIVYVTVPQMMNATQQLEGQVKELNAKVDELTKKLAAETAQKEVITRELEITRSKLEVIEGFLKQALSVYTRP